jgi:hypothetical protein
LQGGGEVAKRQNRLHRPLFGCATFSLGECLQIGSHAGRMQRLFKPPPAKTLCLREMIGRE